MPAFVNLAAIGATSFRSDRLGPLDSVAHPLKPGDYAGEVWRGDDRVGTFTIEVDDDGDGEQIEVDLCAVGKPGFDKPRFRGGSLDAAPVYAVFHCEGERTSLHVVLRDRRNRDSLFDSRALQPGDYYIVTVARPGQWKMKSGRATGVLVVQQATPSAKPRASASGAMIRIDGAKFDPDRAEIVSGDGAVFEITGKDIQIALKLAVERRQAGKQKVGVRYFGRDGAAAADGRGRNDRDPR